MGGLVEHFGSPMINQGMQQTISVFNLGGVVQHFSSPTGNPISTFGNPISAFADGGSTDTDNSEQAKDLRDIKSLINEYRNCLMQKAVCCASDRMMQSHVYKQKAMECKLKASKLIDSYHEKYGGMENSPFTMVDMDEMNQYADGGEVDKRVNFVNDYYQEEIDDLKRRGNYFGFNRERIAKSYKKDMKNAQKGQEFDNFLFEAAYQSKMNNKKFADGGEMVIRYSVYDEEGDLVEMGLSASELIELASTIYYYDAMDADEENISTLDEAMDGFEAMGYSVRESEYGFADGGKTKERVYIDFLNKKKNFQKDRKYFDSYDEARNWAIKTMDKFNPDMIKYEFADGGEFGGGGQFGGVSNIQVLSNSMIKEIRESAKMGYNIVQVGMISPKRKGVVLMNEDYEVRGTYPLEFKEYIEKIVEGKFSKGGVTKNLKRIVRKGTKYGKLAVNKAKPKAKKIIRKAKLGFDALAKKVAQAYEGKKVAPKYQKQYGKTYSKQEAQEVGNKVAAKVKMMKGL